MYTDILMENIETITGDCDKSDNRAINYEIMNVSPTNTCIEKTEIDDLLNDSSFFL